jgi:hypothetical protein
MRRLSGVFTAQIKDGRLGRAKTGYMATVQSGVLARQQQVTNLAPSTSLTTKKDINHD